MSADVVDRLIESADRVLDANAGIRTNGKVASVRTQEYSRQVIHETCRRLRKLGFALESVDALKPKHIDALVKSWHSDGLSNKTMQNQYSRLRIFLGWMGKSKLVNPKGFPGHLPEVEKDQLRVRTYSDESKSWSGRGVNIGEWLEKAKLEDERFWCMLMLGLTFGLRKKEMLRIKPWKADKGVSLDIDGSVAKNGRFRSIVMEGEYGEFQREVLDLVKSKIGRSETLGWPNKTLKQNENRYYRHMKNIGATKYESGVTGHGLRAEFAENQAMLRGLVPPALGGSKKQMSKGEREKVTLEVSNKMGHGRVAVLGAYYGTFRKTPVVPGQIGGRIGTVMLSSEDGGEFAGVHVNPTPVAGPGGKFRKISETERAETVVTIKLEDGGAEYGLAEFLEQRPDTEDRVKKMFEKFGF